MVYIPKPGYTPLDPAPSPPGGYDATQLRVNRQLTHWFIMNDPYPVSLVPRERVRTPTGGFITDDLPPRPQQIVKMIYQMGATNGVTITSDGTNRRYDFIILGEWDSTIKVGDFWEQPDREGQFWVVTGLHPYNGYEVKAGVISYGGHPDGG